MKCEWDDLEPQQYAHIYEADDAPVPDVRRSGLRYWTYGGGCLLGLLLLAGFTLRIPDDLSIPFVLREAAAGHVCRYPFPVYVDAVFAQSGAPVRAGDTLVRISAPEIARLIGAEAAAEAALDGFLHRRRQTTEDTKAITALEAEQYGQTALGIRERIAALRRSWESTGARLRQELDDARRRFAQQQDLHVSRHISALELQVSESELLRARDAVVTAEAAFDRDLETLEAEERRARLQGAALLREADRHYIGLSRDSLSLIHALAGAQAAIRNAFGPAVIADGALLLLAPADGQVSYMFDGERELPPGAILFRLRPAAGALYASSTVSGAQIGLLRQGQAAQLRFESLPVYEWGAAQGHLERLSLSPDERGAFGLRVAIDREAALSGRLQPGMTGHMSLQLGERSFFGYFFRNLRSQSGRAH